MTGRTASARRVPAVVLAAAAFVVVFSGAYNYFVFDHVPHIHDEIVYLFQARIFLGGHFSAPLPCAPDSFDFPHLVNVGRWYSIYPPGFPALLAVGLALGVPWLVNPLLGGLGILLLFWIGLEVYDRRTGILAALLGAVSIWLLLMSSTLMSHAASMVAGAVFILFVFKSLRAPTIGRGLAAGAALGAAVLIRPYNAVILALPFLLGLGFRTLKQFKLRWKNALALVLAVGLASAFYLYYNSATTGRMLTPGYIARYGQAYSVIFGRPATLDYDYTPLIASIQIGENLRAIHNYLFGWPVTSLWPLLLVLWVIVRRPEERERNLLLLSGFLSMLVGFFFFWGAFVVIGARMFFDAWPLLVLLSARGLGEAPGLLAGRFPRVSLVVWKRVLVGAVAVFTLYAFAVRFPAWVAPSWTGWYYARYDHNLAGSSAWVHNAVRSAGLHDALVITKFLYTPLTGFPTGWWGSGFMHDTPRLDGDVIYANDRGPAAALELSRCFPGRKLYLYWGTLERGFLAPLRFEGGVLRPGAAIPSGSPGRRRVELVRRPKDVFLLYSPGFEAFLEDTLRTRDWPEVDALRLRDLGRELSSRGEYLKASWAFEAALQIDREPKYRWRLLADLTQCYVKTGQTAEAKRLMRKLEDSDFRAGKLFNVLPERGI
jgi:hypothetical protein